MSAAAERSSNATHGEVQRLPDLHVTKVSSVVSSSNRVYPASSKSGMEPGMQIMRYCTVKLFVLVEVPPAFVIAICPVVAPAGTVTRMKFAVSTLKFAL